MRYLRSTPLPAASATRAPDPFWLRRAAWACWFLSLALPGFMVMRGDTPETWYGIMILLVGLPLGWWSMGWAVYANVLFWIVLHRVKQGRSAGAWIVLMLLLTVTLPFFSGPMRDEGSGAVLPVMAWGWGALVWLTALLLAAVSGTQQRQLMVRQVRYGLAAGLGVIYVVAVALHMHQRMKANMQEREIYLSGGMAIATTPFSGVTLTWPKGPLIGPDEIPELDIDPILKASDQPYLSLPHLEWYQSDGFAWVTYGDGRIDTVTVRHPASPARFSLRVMATEQGATIQLIQKATGQILYQQALRTLHLDKSGHPTYYPRPGNEKYKGYQQAILRALGETGKPIVATAPQRLQTEIAHEPCNVGEQDIDGIKGLRAWDGRQAILYPLHRGLEKGLCSKSYIALVSAWQSINSSDGLRGGALISDRLTLQPLTSFVVSGGNYDYRNTDIPKDQITEIRISDDHAIIETTQGEARAVRFESKWPVRW